MDERSDPNDEATAVTSAHDAERRANAVEADARARMDDADQRIRDADAQTAHAKTGIDAADAHMRAAKAHMEAVNLQQDQAADLQLRADDQMRAAARLLAAAQDDSAEYQRALYHYTQLMRHRMANPIQVIGGAARTLVDMSDLAEETRQELYAAILDQAEVLERVCLDPEVLGAAEMELHPRPHE